MSARCLQTGRSAARSPAIRARRRQRDRYCLRHVCTDARPDRFVSALSDALGAANKSRPVGAGDRARRTRARAQPQSRHGRAVPARRPRPAGRGDTGRVRRRAAHAAGHACDVRRVCPPTRRRRTRPPPEASRLTRRQRRAVDEIIRAMLEPGRVGHRPRPRAAARSAERAAATARGRRPQRPDAARRRHADGSPPGFVGAPDAQCGAMTASHRHRTAPIDAPYDPWLDLRENWPHLQVVVEPMAGRLARRAALSR